MPASTHPTTLALDDSALSRLQKLSQRWHLSPAEVVSRSLAQAEEADQSHPRSPDTERRLAAICELGKSVSSRHIDTEEWLRSIREARR